MDPTNQPQRFVTFNEQKVEVSHLAHRVKLDTLIEALGADPSLPLEYWNDEGISWYVLGKLADIEVADGEVYRQRPPDDQLEGVEGERPDDADPGVQQPPPGPLNANRPQAMMLVVWRDAVFNADDTFYTNQPTGQRLGEMQTLGFFVEEDELQLTIAQELDRSPQHELWRHVYTIPKSQIVTVIQLGPVADLG